MKLVELSSLQAERDALTGLLDDIPLEDVMDRGGLLAKLDEVRARIAAAVLHRQPAKTTLTFRGRPVIGSHGIYADFGLRAVNGFSEAVVAVAASLTAPLRAKGPIPNREQNQLLITNTALGSFGFELEEPPSAELPFGEKSIVEQAIDKTQLLLLAAAEADDDALADSAAELDQRAVDRVREFVKTLVEGEALCAIEYNDRVFRFENSAQIQRAFDRMSETNLLETTEELAGEFVGAMALKRRSFEFRIADTDEVVVGRFGPGVDRPEDVNRHLFTQCVIRATVTRVGNGRPRYLLQEMPTWNVADPNLPAS
jgi:hypothetical protein